jgi:hypothetical protein
VKLQACVVVLTAVLAVCAGQARELQECTFRPHTSEGVNRQLLSQLMREEDADRAW